MTTPNNFFVDIPAYVPTQVVRGRSQDICRICLESDESISKLFTPCRCSGSISKIHEHCLKEWISKTTNSAERTKCTLCNTEYRFSPLKTHALTFVCVAFNYSFLTVSFYNYCLAGLFGFVINLCLMLLLPDAKDRIFDILQILYVSCVVFYVIILLEFMHVIYVSYFYNLKILLVFRKCFLPAVNSMMIGSIMAASTFGMNMWTHELNFSLFAITGILFNQSIVILYKNLAQLLSKRRVLPYLPLVIENPLIADSGFDEKLYEDGIIIEINMA